jgi:rod shape-determining protein MreD
MAVVVFFLIGIFLIVLQTTVFMFTPLWLAAPDLYFIMVAYLAYRFDLLRSLIIIFLLSWYFDIISGTIMGTYPVMCLGAFFLLKFVSVKTVIRESLYQIPLACVCFLFVSWIMHIILTFFIQDALVPWSWPIMLVRAGLLFLFSFPLFRFFEYMNKKLESRVVPFRLLRVKSGNRYRQG